MSKRTKIIILVLVLIVAAAVYYFVLRRKPITGINATPQYAPQNQMPASGARMVSDLSNGLDADLRRAPSGGGYAPTAQISGGQAAQTVSTSTGARPVLPVYTTPINPTPVYTAPLVASNPVNLSQTDTLSQTESR